jgi:SIR2-like domain
MHFRGIDFPDALLNAQKENMLVVFAGAGVSMSPPANYPSFEGLALQIADGTLPLQKNAPLDRFLGQLKACGTAVHQRAHDILNAPDSRPTPLHYDLLRLFPSASHVRLVTTNFDLHFTTAATSVFSSPTETFCAPALPLGHQFHGIVYLHGSVSKEPERFILTDDDFGRAYLTEGWARRFLQAMFSKYTVLFVGYSHNDVVMNYLARGLPPVTSAPRFAFTSEPERDAGRWHFLGITPLCYPLKRKPKKHRILSEAITDWVSYAALGILDHEQQIRTIVESPPPLDRETADCIERALQDRTTTQFFTRHARMPEWLFWAETKGPFKSLFQVEGALDPVAIELAAWFAKTYVCQHPGIALSVVHRQGQSFHRILWDAIAAEVAFHQPTLALEILAAWVTVLLHSPPARSNLLSSQKMPTAGLHSSHFVV